MAKILYLVTRVNIKDTHKKNTASDNPRRYSNRVRVVAVIYRLRPENRLNFARFGDFRLWSQKLSN